MRGIKIAAFALLGMTSLSGLTLAQSAADPAPESRRASNIIPENTRSTIAPNLPASPAGEDSTPYDYLRAARASLAAGRTGEAQQSLEMAETRALARSVAPEQAQVPNNDPMVIRIRDALHALGAGDRAQALTLIDVALAG